MAIQTGVSSAEFLLQLKKEIARSRLRNHRFSLMVAEFDGFERATPGASSNHQEQRLGLLLEAVKRHIRPGDYVGQTDSQKLSVILPEALQSEATRIFSQWRGHSSVNLIWSTNCQRDGLALSNVCRATCASPTTALILCAVGGQAPLRSHRTCIPAT